MSVHLPPCNSHSNFDMDISISNSHSCLPQRDFSPPPSPSHTDDRSNISGCFLSENTHSLNVYDHSSHTEIFSPSISDELFYYAKSQKQKHHTWQTQHITVTSIMRQFQTHILIFHPVLHPA